MDNINDFIIRKYPPDVNGYLFGLKYLRSLGFVSIRFVAFVFYTMQETALQKQRPYPSQK